MKTQDQSPSSPEIDRALIEAFLNHIPSLAIQGYRKDGTVFYWNKASERIYGHLAAEAVGASLLDLIIPADRREEARQAIETSAATGNPIPGGELTLRRKDGVPVQVYSNHMVVQPVSGETRLYCLDVDLTESKTLEHHLREINHVLLAFREDPARNIQRLTELLGRLLAADCVLYNRADRDLLCTLAAWQAPADLPDRDRAEGHICADVIRRDGDGPLIVRDLPNTPYVHSDPNVSRYGLKTYVGHSVVSNHRNVGSLCAVYTRDFEPSSSDLEVLGLIAAAVGMEEERGELRDQLLQTRKQEAIGRLAGGVAHDVNNILTALSGFTEFIQMDAGDDPVLAPHLRGIQTCIQRISLLARQLLTFSQQREARLEPCDLNQVVRSVAPVIQHTLGDLFEVRLALDDQPCPVLCDGGQLEQALMSLALNAKDAMREPGPIEIGTDAAARRIHELDGLFETPLRQDGNEYIALYVKDHGVGMSPEVRDKLFEPFFSTKEFGHSTGLGLSSVYGIVHQHHGLLGLVSEPGAGSTFYIYLPTSMAEPFQGPHPGAGLAAVHPGDRTAILLVEDDDAIRLILQKSLEVGGYTVHPEPNAEAALRRIERENLPFQLLVTDIVMPGMNGKELADTLRRHVPGLPVLFITGYIPEKVEACGLDPERDPILYKPFMPRQVLDKVRTLLEAAI